MSKPVSGYFKNTIGALRVGDVYESPEEIIKLRSQGLDLRAHPRKVRGLSSKQKKQMEAAINKRTITKQEYRLFMSDKRFQKRRNHGVKAFWKQERTRILNGQRTTRQWTPAQKKDILNGKRPKFKGKTMQGHHSYSAKQYPHLADKGNIIFPVTHEEHLQSWHGGNYKRSFPGRPIKSVWDF